MDLQMTTSDWLGYAAATLTTVAFIPQALKALRQHDTRSLSVGMYAIFTLGVALWGLYGYLRHDWAIVIANAITGALSLAILIAKLRNDGISQRRVRQMQRD
jgi:MtN3 and saliva related transmembrane protein